MPHDLKSEVSLNSQCEAQPPCSVCSITDPNSNATKPHTFAQTHRLQLVSSCISSHEFLNVRIGKDMKFKVCVNPILSVPVRVQSIALQHIIVTLSVIDTTTSSTKRQLGYIAASRGQCLRWVEGPSTLAAENAEQRKTFALLSRSPWPG